MGKPEQPESFLQYETDGVQIYLAKDIQPHESGITIYMKKFLWIKELAVDGIYAV